MDLASFDRSVRSATLDRTFYLFSGREEFLKERAFDSMVAAFVTREDVADNVRRIDMGVSDSSAADEIGSFSFNESYRLFYFDHPESLSDKQRKDFLGRISRYENSPRTFVVFSTGDQKTGGEISTALAGKLEKIDFWPPFENQMPEWIQKEAANCGCRIEPKAVRLLLEKLGDDLRLLSKEILKLSLNPAKKGLITLEQIRDAVSYCRSESVFQILDWIGLRNLPETLRTLELLTLRGEPAIKIWAMICRMLREFRLLHDFARDRPDLAVPVMKLLAGYLKLANKSDFNSNREKKGIQGDIISAIRQWPEMITDFLNMKSPMRIKTLALALNFRAEELRALWPAMMRVDARLKSASPDPVLVIQEFLTVLLSGNPKTTHI